MVALRRQVDVIEQRPVQHDVATALGVRRHAAELVQQEHVRAAERGDASPDGVDHAGVDRLGRGAVGSAMRAAGSSARKEARRAATCSAQS